jgi:Tfp pilus assembly protein PilE
VDAKRKDYLIMSHRFCNLRHAFTLVELFIVFLVVGILVAFAIPDFIGCCGGRSKASRVRADLRSLATGVESYFVDNNVYPNYSDNPAINANREAAQEAPVLFDVPTFRADYPRSGYFTITTPIAYITSYFTDPFAPAKRATFAYWTPDPKSDAVGWIMWSPGPDKDYDLTIANVALAYNPNDRVPNDYLIERTYDSTNGTESNGDVYRIKE